MNLAPPERLLALLLRTPAGVTPADATAELGAATAAAAVTELDRRGHALQTSPNLWRLPCAARHFDPAVFAARQRGRLGAVFEVWETTTSTNDLARAGIARGAVDGALWIAEAQTGGRGRQGRAWSCAPHAGLLVSWAMHGALAAASRPALLPLALGVGACEGLRRATGCDVGTKWPNDLWLAERKLAGLLVEARHGATPHAVAGLGINVEAAAIVPAELPAATTLAENRVTVRREALLAAVLEDVGARLDDWRSGRHAEILQAWRQVDVTLGRTVRVETPAGILEGTVRGVSAAGSLQLEAAGGRCHELHAGEVHLR